MTDDLPYPPVPSNSDLRSYPWMPLDISRLMTSETWMLGTDAQKVASLTLWMKSWHQVPAGSLPDNDRMLEQLSERLKDWPKVRSFAMRGWFKCSDGRLYHATVCEKANEALERQAATEAKREAQAQKMKAWREAKRSQQQLQQPSRDGIVTVTETITSLATQPSRDGHVTSITVQDKTVPPKSPFSGLSDVVPCRATGRPTVNGLYLDTAAEWALQAAKIDPARWRGDYRALIGWLRDDIYPETIRAAITRVASNPNYKPPFSLQYFDKAVREQPSEVAA